MFELAIVIGISVFALILAAILARSVLAQDEGMPKMREVSDAIRVGAEAFIKRQYSTIAILAIVLAVVIFGVYFLTGQQGLATYTAIAFIVGASCSALAGVIGMSVAVRTNIRTAAAAQTSDGKALDISFRGGAVSGLIITAMSLLGVSLTYYALGADPQHTPFIIVGFAFGASFVALFAQLGGGIYTKAADVGADLVGKVEAGIPEDDVRNPAVIADLVGDNVGDCAGRGADLFESTAAENIGAMILAAMLFKSNAAVFGNEPATLLLIILFPLLARAFGLIASIVGIMFVKAKENEDPMNALNRGYYLTSFLAIIGFGVASYWIFGTGTAAVQAPTAWWHFFISGIIGVVTSVLFLWITQYYTEYKYGPVQSIAEATKTGPATTIISGVAIGFECVALPSIVIAVAI